MAKHLDWLFTEYGFRITNSEYSPTFGGEGVVRLENDTLRIELVSDRDRTFLEFSPKDGLEGNTVTYDLIKQMLTKEVCDESIMINASQIAFLHDNFPKIISLFSTTEKGDLLKKIKSMKKARAKRLFG